MEGRREGDGDEREEKTMKEGEGRTTLRFLVAVMLTRSVSIASMFSAPAEKVQFS